MPSLRKSAALEQTDTWLKERRLRLHHAGLAHLVDMVNKFASEDKHLLCADGQVQMSMYLVCACTYLYTCAHTVRAARAGGGCVVAGRSPSVREAAVWLPSGHRALAPGDRPSGHRALARVGHLAFAQGGGSVVAARSPSGHRDFIFQVPGAQAGQACAGGRRALAPGDRPSGHQALAPGDRPSGLSLDQAPTLRLVLGGDVVLRQGVGAEDAVVGGIR